VVETPSPSFLAWHPRLDVLYAVNETDPGTVSAIADGTLLGTWPTGGAFPCHLAVVPGSPDRLVVANYGGTLGILALDRSGRPRETTVHSSHTQHPHMIIPWDDGVLYVDLGLDAVFRYGFDGALSTVVRLPGSGPRHLVHDSRGYVHVVGENDASVISLDPEWHEVGRARATTAAHSYPSEIVLWNDFGYVANRGPHTIAVFTVAAGPARFVGEVPSGGAWPRHLAIVDGYLYAANEHSNLVVTFRLDPATGQPSPTGAALATPSPTCLLFSPR
jgi:6-phosphogluconolactonase